MSYEGVGGTACVGSVVPNFFWYPLGVGQYLAYQGQTFEIWFYHSGVSTEENVLRESRQDGSITSRISYRISGDAQGPHRWNIRISGVFSSITAGFNYEVVPFEWHRMVVRSLANGDTTTAPDFTAVGNRVLIQIGKVGKRTNGASVGADTFPYGAGANGGIAIQSNQPAVSPNLWRPLKMYAGIITGVDTRISWGGSMATGGVTPLFSRRWRGGYCEERLWLPALTDAQVQAGSGFVADGDPAVYLRFNQSIPDMHLYTPTGSVNFPDQVGFSYGGSAKIPGQGDVAMINHVDPIINSAVDNPSGFPAHPFSAIANEEDLDFSGEYRVLRSEDDLAIGEYRVSAPTGVLRTGEYRTNSFGTDTATGEYRASYPLFLARSGQYKVANPSVDLQATGSYSVLDSEVDLTATGEYEVEQVPTDILRTGQYKVLQVVEITGGTSDLFTETVLSGTVPTNWWRLDEASGSLTVADTGTDGAGGGTVNGPSLGAPGLLSDDETSASFDQSGDEIISVLDEAVWQTSVVSHDYTWNVWVRLQAVVDGIGTIFRKTAYANLRITESGGLMAARYERTTDSASLRTMESSFGSIQTDTSHMITVTFDRSNFLGMKMYIDGVEVASDPGTFGQNTPLNQLFFVGGVFNNIATNNGIQHVQFYNDILLQPSEIANLYAAGQPVGGSVGTGEYKVAAPQTINRSGSYRVDGIPPIDINRFGSYSVTSGVVELGMSGDYRVSSGPGILQATGAYEVDAGIQEINLQRSGEYAVRNADNEREAALRKLAWLRMKTK